MLSSALLTKRLAPRTMSLLRPFARTYVDVSQEFTTSPPKAPYKVCFIGSGNWGSAASWIAAQNTLLHPEWFESTVEMYVHDELVSGADTDEVKAAWNILSPYLSEESGEVIDATAIQLLAAEVGVAMTRSEAMIAMKEMDYDKDNKATKEEFFRWWEDSGKSSVGRLLTSVINIQRENTKYLPGIKLGDNVTAVTDLAASAAAADLLVFVTPHQFIDDVLGELKGVVKPNARAISLVKGMEITPQGFNLISKVIERELDIKCSVLMGANIASEIAEGCFSEATVGSELAEDREVWLRLFNTALFQTRGSSDVAAVEMCGTLKNIVAIGAGFTDGLGEGNNAKAAIIRVGFGEMISLIKRAFPDTNDQTFMESCGIADLITTCYGGRNRKCAEVFVQRGGSVSFDDIEQELLGGQKLQGVLTSNEVQELIEGWGAEEEFPLMVTINRIIKGDIPPKAIVRYKEMPSRVDYEVGKNKQNATQDQEGGGDHELSGG